MNHIFDLIGKRVTDVKKVNKGLPDEKLDIIFDNQIILSVKESDLKENTIALYKKDE